MKHGPGRVQPPGGGLRRVDALHLKLLLRRVVGELDRDGVLALQRYRVVQAVDGVLRLRPLVEPHEAHAPRHAFNFMVWEMCYIITASTVVVDLIFNLQPFFFYLAPFDFYFFCTSYLGFFNLYQFSFLLLWKL